jgi:hypothetical protein
MEPEVAVERSKDLGIRETRTNGSVPSALKGAPTRARRRRVNGRERAGFSTGRVRPGRPVNGVPVPVR